MASPRQLGRSVRIGLLASAMFSSFYLLTEKTSWLQRNPIICGGWVQGGFVETTDLKEDIVNKEGVPSFCVREILRPYSDSMADVWAGVTIYPNRFNDQKILYVESQFFVAKDFGAESFSDEPGDWVAKNVRSYSQVGLLVGKSEDAVSSAVTSYLEPESAIALWEIMQKRISAQYESRVVSPFRLISENATQLTVIGLVLLIAGQSIGRIVSVVRVRRELNACDGGLTHDRGLAWANVCAAITYHDVRHEILKISFLLALSLSVWSVFRYTNWLRPTSFKCNEYQSVQAGGSLKVCFSEILCLPSDLNQSIVAGVTVDDGTTFFSGDMEFYIADGNNSMGFSDEEGDWAFLGYRQFDSKTGLLKRRSEVTTSVWHDTVFPEEIQLPLWRDVRDDLARNYAGIRLSITRKIADVLGSFAALGGAVLIASLTFVRAVELALIRELQESEQSNPTQDR